MLPQRHEDTKINIERSARSGIESSCETNKKQTTDNTDCANKKDRDYEQANADLLCCFPGKPCQGDTNVHENLDKFSN